MCIDNIGCSGDRKPLDAWRKRAPPRLNPKKKITFYRKAPDKIIDRNVVMVSRSTGMGKTNSRHMMAQFFQGTFYVVSYSKGRKAI